MVELRLQPNTNEILSNAPEEENEFTADSESKSDSRSRSRSASSGSKQSGSRGNQIVNPVAGTATHSCLRVNIENKFSMQSKMKRRSSKAGMGHHAGQHLADEVRVGFSLYNVTGLPLRYLQEWEGKYTVQYLNDKERGLLNFIASKTVICNKEVVESAFSVQREQGFERNRVRRLGSGHRVSLQVCGYNWIWEVNADTLGPKFRDLDAVIGRVSPRSVKDDWRLQHALKLVTEVTPFNGGRLLRVGSVVRVRNKTNHSIEILAHEIPLTDVNPAPDHPFSLASGEVFHVPISLLQRSACRTNARSLGCLWLKPKGIAPVQAEVGPSHRVDKVSYSSVPINLLSIVLKTAELYQEFTSGETVDGEGLVQLSCLIGTKLRGGRGGLAARSRADSVNLPSKEHAVVDQTLSTDAIVDQRFEKLPPYCYVVDIRRSDEGDYKNPTLSQETPVDSSSYPSRLPSSWQRDVDSRRTSEQPKHSPIFYTLGKSIISNAGRIPHSFQLHQLFILPL